MAQTFDDFRNLHSNRKVPIETDKGVKYVGHGEWWLNQSGRRQYTSGVKFMPQYDEDEVNGDYNTWRGFAVPSRKPEG